MDIKMHAINKTPKTPDLGDGKNMDPVSVKYLPKKGGSKDSCCSIDEEKRQLRAQRPVWRENFTDFCRNGSLHGFRHLVDSYSKIRKVIWLVILLLVFIMFLYALIIRITAYLQYPMTSTIRDIYVKELKFPSVTICNKNPCTMSHAYKRGWQDILNANASFTGELGSVQLLDYQNTCAQNLENMIVKCQFKGRKCSAKDFKSVYTESGHCYTFESSDTSTAMTRKPGPEHGLRLLLNAETAEYSPSANGQEGFHVSLHDGTEGPAASISIAPGTSTSVSVVLTEIHTLPPPFGHCGETSLNTQGPYSQSKCYEECLQARIRATCFCDAVLNIPAPDNKFPVCGMKIYTTCAKPIKANLTIHECNCPPSCRRNDFTSTVSFSRLSNKYVETVIAEKAKVNKSNDIERNFVENKLMQYHHAHQDTETVRFDDVISAYNASVSVTYPYLKSSIAQVADMLKNMSSGGNGRAQFVKYTGDLLKEYDSKYHASVFSALQSAELLVNKYLDAVTAFAFVTDQVNYTTGRMDENRVSQILRLKLDEFRIHYEHTIQCLDRVDKFYEDKKLRDYDQNHKKARQMFRTGIISLYANISAISMHQNGNIDKFYRVADIFHQEILKMGSDAYFWYRNELRNLTKVVGELSDKLLDTVKIVINGPRQWDNFVDSTLYRSGSPTYVYEAEKHWETIKQDYLTNPGNITHREFVVSRANGDLKNLTHFVVDVNQDLDKLEKAVAASLDLVEELYTVIIEADVLPNSVLGTYPMWNMSSSYRGINRIRWGSLAERNRPMFEFSFKDTMQHVREKLLSRKIPRQYYPNGIFDHLQSEVRSMDNQIQTSLTKLKDHMIYFLNSVSIEDVFREELYKDNFCQLDIFYQDLSIRRIEDRAYFTADGLLMYIGILLAVYFGGSIVSIVELLDVVIRSMYTKYCHRRENST